MQTPHIVFLTGAGISAESGIKTFRDSDGLWEGHNIEDVATPQAWDKNKSLVLDFYNQRRKNVLLSKPNRAHELIAELEKKYPISVITQNVDNLHERAGSTNVIHLHGEICKARSSINESLIYDLNGWELNIGQLCEIGSQLRPHIVWFGESVPLMENAIEIVQTADFLVIIGTSMVVYPAASLINYRKNNSKIFVIDPKIPNFNFSKDITFIKKTATEGMQKLINHHLML